MPTEIDSECSKLFPSLLLIARLIMTVNPVLAQLDSKSYKWSTLSDFFLFSLQTAHTGLDLKASMKIAKNK